ncbi:MFS transporter [Cupriavidus necator]|uniref:MFS transporter n=1 Tax=Cupriavidus necator TaxID=106590 RepID=UPI0039C3FE64
MTSINLGALPASAVSAQQESRVKAWGFTLLLVFLFVVNWADKAVLGLVAQPLGQELHLTASQIGLVGSGFFLAYAIGGFLAGPINKWMAMRWSLVVLALVWAACMLPLLVVANFGVLLISRVALGLAEGPSGALIYTGVYSWHPVEKRGLPGACVAGAASIAKIALAPALAVVIAAWGWRAAFLTLGIIGVAWCGIWLLSWREGPYGELREGKRPAPGGPVRQPSVRWLSIFCTPTFLGALAAVFAMYAVVTVILTWLPSYFEVGLGYSRLHAGTMFGFPSIAALSAMALSAFVGDRLIARRASTRILRGVLPALGLLLCGLAMVALPYVRHPAVAVLVVSLGYGMGTIVFPLLNAAISQICPPQQLAGTLGVFLAVMSVGGIIAPYLTGRIVDASSPAAGFALAFQIFGALSVLCAVIALLTVNPERDAARVMG